MTEIKSTNFIREVLKTLQEVESFGVNTDIALLR